MMDFFGWFFVACAIQSGVNTYRHAKRKLDPSYWGGASGTGQACVAGACLAMAAMTQLPSTETTPLLGVTSAGFVALFTLGLKLEARATREYKASKSSPTDLDRPNHDVLPSA